MTRLFLLGCPGSGKTRIGNLLSEQLSVQSYDVGEILRQKSKEANEQAESIRSVHKEGGLVSSGLVLPILQGILNQQDFVCIGSPRRPEEAKMILEHENPGFLIHLDVSFDVARKRLENRGRFDDNAETLTKRFSEYESKTLDSVEQFQSASRLISIDASRTPEEICKEILQKVRNIS